MMESFPRTAGLVSILPIAWAPYVALLSYWHHLLETVPGADRGEVSGPIQFFLPWLLGVAIFVSIITLGVLVQRVARRPPTAE
jgi:hypothetical protein